MVAGLFAAYAADPALMPAEWREALPAEEPGRSRHIADFIAGMTDRYAIARYREAVGSIDLPEGVLSFAPERFRSRPAERPNTFLRQLRRIRRAGQAKDFSHVRRQHRP
jgi:hypothetical protein